MMTSSFSQYFFCSLMLAFYSVAVQAANADLRKSLEGIETVDAEQLIALAQGVDDLILVDSRLAEDRGLGFIGESHNLPDFETNCTTLARISTDRDRSMVFYCNGEKCGRSKRALKIARQCGYQQLYWFRGGFEEWRKKDYPYLLD